MIIYTTIHFLTSVHQNTNVTTSRNKFDISNHYDNDEEIVEVKNAEDQEPEIYDPSYNTLPGNIFHVENYEHEIGVDNNPDEHAKY